MANTQQQQIAREWIGHNVVDDHGDKIGAIDEIYLDDATGRPEWLAVKTGWFGKKLSFAPLQGATARGDDICLPFSKDKVKGAPKLDPEGHLDVDQEENLYRYYGYGGYGAGMGAQTGEGHERSLEEHPTREGMGATDTSEGMTLSEEELSFDKKRRESGRARLRKYVVTENVTMTVPVEHEEARVVHEPIAGERGMAGADLGEAEQEVILHEEEVVPHKEVVAKERVRLEKDVVTDQREVSETLRKEQVELDEGNARRR